MGYEVNRFVKHFNKGSLSIILCAICRKVVEDPIIAPCEHKLMFCSACVYSQPDDQKTCPKCPKKEFTKSDFRPADTSFKSLMNSLIIRCKHDKFGCTRVFKLQDITKHESECEFAFITCPKECGRSFQKIARTPHLAICKSEHWSRGRALPLWQTSALDSQDTLAYHYQEKLSDLHADDFGDTSGEDTFEEELLLALAMTETLPSAPYEHNRASSDIPPYLNETDGAMRVGSHERVRKLLRAKYNRSRTQPDLRLVLLGMTGVGKSSTANTIIGREHFKVDCGGSSITFKCDHATAMVHERKVLVVDTPPLFDTRKGNEEAMREMTKCVSLSAPGPHAIIMVVDGSNRQTAQIQACAQSIMDTFGKPALRHMILLFTHRDDLEFHGKSVEQYVKTLPQKMRAVLLQCGSRYLAFNNRYKSVKERDEQVKELLTKIDEMVHRNGEQCFTYDVYKQFEKEIVARENARREQLEKKKAEELKLIEAQFEEEIQQIKERLKRKFEEERKRELEKAQLEVGKKKPKQKETKGSQERLRQQMEEEEEEEERRILKDKQRRRVEAKYNEKLQNVTSEVLEEVQTDMRLSEGSTGVSVLQMIFSKTASWVVNKMLGQT